MSKHSLAAVLFSDITGFSSLASTNEAKALQLIEMNRQHQKPIIQKYGTFIKEMGDGMMATFKSARDAIACAYEIQSTVPNALNSKIRIGIHLGDIEEVHGDVFGDGVNIASRIESVAEPGAIFISESVYSSIKSRDDIQTVFIGEKNLKNIAEPVKCYKVLRVDESVLKSTRNKYSPTVWVLLVIIFISALLIFRVIQKQTTYDNPTIVVLPFSQLAGDSSDLLLQKGISYELISSLGKNERFTVINSLTSTRYLSTFNPFERRLPICHRLIIL